ncbi:hypothetical protein AKO1_014773 [Acrasis kona]|uniref:AAA+ ATPase domain-containing protein n=1 Tax=Acrasis kona TaxID=1008807 RepID=A0AAW2Z2D4_9EUKA
MSCRALHVRLASCVSHITRHSRRTNHARILFKNWETQQSIHTSTWINQNTFKTILTGPTGGGSTDIPPSTPVNNGGQGLGGSHDTGIGGAPADGPTGVMDNLPNDLGVRPAETSRGDKTTPGMGEPADPPKMPTDNTPDGLNNPSAETGKGDKINQPGVGEAKNNSDSSGTPPKTPINEEKTNGGGSGGSSGKGSSGFITPLDIIAFVISAGAIYFSVTKNTLQSPDSFITFETFKQEYLAEDKVDYISYSNKTNVARIHTKLPEDPRSTSSTDRFRNINNPVVNVRMLSVEDFEKKLNEAEKELNVSSANPTPVQYRDNNQDNIWTPILINVAIVGFLAYSIRRASGSLGNLMGGMSNVKGPTEVMSKVKFADVAGMDEAKMEITEFIDFLKQPEKFKTLGAKIPRGAILFGPPGTGKTLLAKAVAGESGVPFFSMSGSDFVEIYVGVGASRVRELFSKARAFDKVIIYIDEIDAIGRPRGKTGRNDEREATLNQLLVEMDGFKENQNVVIMASTNSNPSDIDDALLRPGRFDRQITVDKPTQSERIEIFKVHLKKIKLSPQVNERIQRLAELTPGFSGADIANACNEAAIHAARNAKDQVGMEDMEKAIERVVGGIEKKNMPISQEEKNIIAYHEAGHAIVSWFSKYCDPLLKVSIIPRGKALGYAQYVPKERFIRTYDQLVELIAQALGGRVAEKIMFGHLSTGAKDDLQKITRIAYSAISTFGMSKLGPVSYPVPGQGSMNVQKPYSEETAEVIDQEVRDLVSDVFEKTEKLLIEKKHLLEEVAQYLIKNEVMNLEQFKSIVGPRPYPQTAAEGPDPVPVEGQEATGDASINEAAVKTEEK